MTRDLSYYFEKDYESVFNAFYRAANIIKRWVKPPFLL